MRKPTGMRPRNSSRGRPLRTAMRFATGVLSICVGSILSTPFIYFTFISEYHFAVMSWWPYIIVAGLVIGGPMVFGGILGILTSESFARATNNYSDLDTARIRHAVETEVRENLYGRQRNK